MLFEFRRTLVSVGFKLSSLNFLFELSVVWIDELSVLMLLPYVVLICTCSVAKINIENNKIGFMIASCELKKIKE